MRDLRRNGAGGDETPGSNTKGGPKAAHAIVEFMTLEA
jgi:hypothetical protein